MDKTDEKLLSNLEDDGRMSLKKLAKQIDVKTSTLYHRLHKLQENKILINPTVIVNPESIGVKLFYLFILKLKLSDDEKNFSVFQESFSTYLAEEFKEIFFGSLGEDLNLYLLVSFFSESHKNEFIESFLENPYLEKFKMIQLNSINKGLRCFSYNDDYLLQQLMDMK